MTTRKAFLLIELLALILILGAIIALTGPTVAGLIRESTQQQRAIETDKHLAAALEVLRCDVRVTRSIESQQIIRSILPPRLR